MLYLILFTYRAPLDVLDRVLPAHRAHLQAHYASGHFLMSGPFFPREGGGILARGIARGDRSHRCVRSVRRRTVGGGAGDRLGAEPAAGRGAPGVVARGGGQYPYR